MDKNTRLSFKELNLFPLIEKVFSTVSFVTCLVLPLKTCVRAIEFKRFSFMVDLSQLVVQFS